MDFREKIPATFGLVDHEFANFPSDEMRAIELLKVCCQNDVSMKDLLLAVEEYLREADAGDDHIKGQLNEVKSKFSGWLKVD